MVDDKIKEIEKAKKSSKKIVFLAGNCSEGNTWREVIKEALKDEDFLFLDPFDSDWEADENIYSELAGLEVSDYVVFYKPGKLSKKEKEYLDIIDKEYREFDTTDEILEYLKGLRKKKRKKLSSLLRELAINMKGFG